MEKFNATKRAAYLEKLKEGGRRGASAQEIGIVYETVRAHLHSDPAFKIAVEDAEMEANELVEDALREAALAGNVVACQVWLYNRDPERWKDRRQHQHTGPDGGEIPLGIRFVNSPPRPPDEPATASP